VSFAILFLLVPIGAIIAWWLSHQRLMAKPWLEVSAIGEVPDTGASSLPAATIGLGLFLAVVSSLFALFISAYFMRMQVADWVQLPAPKLLWFNTGALILSSVALQYAQVAARRGRIENVGDGLIVGGRSAVRFYSHFLLDLWLVLFSLLTPWVGDFARLLSRVGDLRRTKSKWRT
jgi:cytochrome c oxidase subunit III